MTSINLFETPDQANESTRVAATWIREENLETAFPNTPKVTAGVVVAHETNGAFKASTAFKQLCTSRRPASAGLLRV